MFVIYEMIQICWKFETMSLYLIVVPIVHKNSEVLVNVRHYPVYCWLILMYADALVAVSVYRTRTYKLE